MDILQLSIKTAAWIAVLALLVIVIVLTVSSNKTEDKEKASNLRLYAVFCLTFMCVITVFNVSVF